MTKCQPCRKSLSALVLFKLSIDARYESAGAWANEPIVDFLASLLRRKYVRRLKRGKMIGNGGEIKLREFHEFVYAMFRLHELLGDPETYGMSQRLELGGGLRAYVCIERVHCLLSL